MRSSFSHFLESDIFLILLKSPLHVRRIRFSIISLVQNTYSFIPILDYILHIPMGLKIFALVNILLYNARIWLTVNRPGQGNLLIQIPSYRTTIRVESPLMSSITHVLALLRHLQISHRVIFINTFHNSPNHSETFVTKRLKIMKLGCK